MILLWFLIFATAIVGLFLLWFLLWAARCLFGCVRCSRLMCPGADRDPDDPWPKNAIGDTSRCTWVNPRLRLP